jgi:hypothetical protein
MLGTSVRVCPSAAVAAVLTIGARYGPLLPLLAMTFQRGQRIR